MLEFNFLTENFKKTWLSWQPLCLIVAEITRAYKHIFIFGSSLIFATKLKSLPVILVSQQRRCCSPQPSPTQIWQQILSFKMVSPKVLGSWKTGRGCVCGTVMQTPGGIFSQFLQDFEKFPKAQLDSSRSLSRGVRSQNRSEAPPSSQPQLGDLCLEMTLFSAWTGRFPSFVGL